MALFSPPSEVLAQLVMPGLQTDQGLELDPGEAVQLFLGMLWGVSGGPSFSLARPGIWPPAAPLMPSKTLPASFPTGSPPALRILLNTVPAARGSVRAGV